MSDQDAVTRLNAALEGRYRIERQLGEGGMATVYLADDLRHERKVALKVLKPELAAVVGADRFLAEIKTTANLQHPHILPLFDSGEADSFLFYVMPFVEGETLRDRLDREQQLPVNEAVRIATNVAEALGYAHSHGVIHRDIKPANILLQSGKPVISDFGIALAVRAGGGDRLTETGLSVGTPHYMSPEQATGDQLVGPASDVYALGCVLYEMLVGEPPYTGSNAQAILGKIIQGQASRVTDIRKSTPDNVASAVARSLEKLPADRFATADEFAHALEDPAFRWGEPVGAAGAVSGIRLWRALAMCLAIVAVALAGGLALALSRPEPPRRALLFPQPFARGEEPTGFGQGAFELSPDGSYVVYPGPSVGDDDQMWVRRWDALESTPIPSSLAVCCPDVSPDGRGVVFAEDGAPNTLVILPIDGGPPRNLGDGTRPIWGDDGFIYFQRDNDLYRVPAAGGDAELLLAADPGSYFMPQGLLPGGDALLARVIRPNGQGDVRVIELPSGESTVLFEGTDRVRYLPTGHLLYLAEGVLTAVPFDAGARELRGSPVPLMTGLQAFSVSEDGKLLYATGTATASLETELVWVGRSGEVEPVDPGWTFDRGAGNAGWSLSPDGTRIALRILTDGNRDIWVKELLRGALRRITRDPGVDWVPIWTPDGERVIYLHNDGALDIELWQANADGTGAPELLFPAPGAAQEAVTPDGTQFLLRRGNFGIGGARDILTFRLGVDSALVPLIATAEFDEQDPAVSPDGKWLAYTSTETGRGEVYVVSFPDAEAQKIPVSTRGGFLPVWGRDRQELYYVRAGSGSVSLVAASYRTEPRFQITGDTVLFAIPDDVQVFPGGNVYSVAPDGQRFLMGRDAAAAGGDAASGDAAERPEYVLILNFFEEVKRRVPN